MYSLTECSKVLAFEQGEGPFSIHFLYAIHNFKSPHYVLYEIYASSFISHLFSKLKSPCHFSIPLLGRCSNPVMISVAQCCCFSSWGHFTKVQSLPLTPCFRPSRLPGKSGYCFLICKFFILFTSSRPQSNTLTAIPCWHILIEINFTNYFSYTPRFICMLT